MSFLCASIVAETTDGVLVLLPGLAGRADLAEVRLDRIAEPDLAAIVRASPIPLVATCRTAALGGAVPRSDDDRLALLAAAARAGFAWVDCEIETFPRYRRVAGEKVIASFHDFSGTPADLDRIVRDLAATGADLLKIATLCRDFQDAARLLLLPSRAPRPLAALGMGEAGLATRVLGPRFGSAVVYAAAEAGAEAAPGQPSVADLIDAYRFRAVGPATRLHGIVGNPVAHSLSPFLHNRLFARGGVDAVYCQIPAADAAAAAVAARSLGFAGLSVTAPHKEAFLRLVDAADPAARACGAVNTVVAEGGLWAGSNTDAAAAVDALAAEGSVRGKTALVLGTGGAARAVAWGLREAGAGVAVAGRNADRALALASAIRVPAIPWEMRESSARRCAIVVNATTVGMAPNVEASLLPARAFRRGQVAMDAVYAPARTRFLRDAAAAGARAVGGIEWFARQAARQSEAWTGIRPEIALVRDILGSKMNCPRGLSAGT